jgi:LacI family transcriptional regulator
MTNNFGGAKKGTEHLIECGAKNLLCLRGPKGIQTADERERGFYAAVEQYNVKGKTVEAGFDFHEAVAVIDNVLKQDETIDGIFASSDLAAIAAVKTIHNLKKQVPEQIQVVGFDGIDLGTMISSELTTVCQDIYQIGKHATVMLIEQIEGLPLKETTIIVETTLRTRGTTRKERNK